MRIILIVVCAVAVVSTAISVLAPKRSSDDAGTFDATKNAVRFEVERARWERAI
jgi:hypothetical protein